MKDEQARDDIRKAVRAQSRVNSDLWLYLERIRKWVSSIAGTANLHEKDCPVCGHKTLMREDDPSRFTFTGGTIGIFSGVTPNPPAKFYCYSCGGTYVEKTTTELAKEEHAQS
jgi:transposase-like protein